MAAGLLSRAGRRCRRLRALLQAPVPFPLVRLQLLVLHRTVFGVGIPESTVGERG